MTNIAGMVEDERIVVAYLGPEGSYTHQATLSAFPDNNSVNISPQTTISDVFAAVQSGTAARGVVPFENSSNGSVVFTLDLFADLQGKYPDILVCDEAYVQVQHCLLGHAVAPAPAPAEGNTTANTTTTTTNTNNNQNNPSPHPSFTHIKTLYSHPQAWGQCTNFLTTYLPHTTRHDVASTSLAAQLVAQDTSHTSAALSSISAASLFHLDVLAHTVNDRVGNTTRFLVIRKGRRGVGVGGQESPRQIAQQQEQEEEEKEEETKRFKSLVTFIPDDDAHPGRLVGRIGGIFSLSSFKGG
ncbi:hypothetical protein J1614_005131 [Plenodomus biglobosus]|nr:hypothetical protein J1614_005131 [Plenodomus biglobosus]